MNQSNQIIISLSKYKKTNKYKNRKALYFQAYKVIFPIMPTLYPKFQALQIGKAKRKRQIKNKFYLLYVKTLKERS